MKREQLLKTASKIVMAYNTIEKCGQANILPAVAEGMGYSVERVITAIQFMQDEIGEKEMNANCEKDAFVAYLEAIDEIEKYMEMAKGYQEMGEVNLTIAQEDHHLEEEGAKLHEMDSEASKGDTEAG